MMSETLYSLEKSVSCDFCSIFNVFSALALINYEKIARGKWKTAFRVVSMVTRVKSAPRNCAKKSLKYVLKNGWDFFLLFVLSRTKNIAKLVIRRNLNENSRLHDRKC